MHTTVQARLRPHLPALAPGLLVIALLLVWSAHDGGYDADTWYWGALLLLCALAAVAIASFPRRPRWSRLQVGALAAFGLYVAWSYLSISWARSPGDALEGSNRALLYLLVFALMAALPWTPEGALVALLAFALGIGAIALVILLRLASGDHVSTLVTLGRLQSPTGYFNATVALFTMGALVAVALAARRDWPAVVRGILIATACADLQLAVMGQSRGWLFTLPLVVIAAIAVVRDRLRVVAASVLPIVATLVPVHQLTAVFNSSGSAALDHTARTASRNALLLCLVMLVAGTVIGAAEARRRPPPLSRRARLLLGSALALLAVAGGSAGAVAATRGHPVAFVKRQWNGFTNPRESAASGSHFATVGSSRYDFWRVSLDAFVAHPVGGLGQDNFDGYYVRHRRTLEEPAWTHSLELRLLVHTGFVGFALFAAFLVTAIVAALRSRAGRAPSVNGRRPPPREASRGRELTQAAAGVALLPLVVWLIHGSIDWFWEMPALAAPALGFLGLAGALRPSAAVDPRPKPLSRRWTGLVAAATGILALLGAAFALGFPYLAVRETSVANDLRATNAAQSLRDLKTAADLNPLSAVPGRVGGTIALQIGRYGDAEGRFRQAIARDPGGWFAWFGAGLAASALGDEAGARHYLQEAAVIDPPQPVVDEALARVHSGRPLTPAEALHLVIVR